MDKDKGSTIKNYQPNEKPILCSRDLEIHNPCREKHWEITIWLWAENRNFELHFEPAGGICNALGGLLLLPKQASYKYPPLLCNSYFYKPI